MAANITNLAAKHVANHMTEVMCVTACVVLEAGGTTEDEIIAVANVIFNRAAERNLTPFQVISQRKQFSSMLPFKRKSKIDRTRLLEKAGQHPKFQKVFKLAMRGYRGELKDNTNGANHFHDVSVIPYWSVNMRLTAYSRNFRFFNDKY